MFYKARCGLRRLINVLSSWETVLLFWMGAILRRRFIVSGLKELIWGRKACKMIVLWWFDPLVRRGQACAGFHVWRCLLPLTLGLNFKKNVFMELIMICANKQGEEKQERRWKHAVRRNKQTNKTAQWEATFPQSAEATTLLLFDSQHGETFALWIRDALWDACPTFLSASVRDRPCSSGICSLTAEFAVWVYFHLLCGLLPVPSSVLGNLSYFSLLFVILILFGIIIVWTLASSWVYHLISHSCQARPRLLPSSSVLSFHFAS